jgi:hypothetical protein
VHEWLASRRAARLTGWDAFDALIGMFDGPAMSLADQHDEFGLGSDHQCQD